VSLSAALILTGLIFLAALLYSSVGFAGASGYLAAMALFGLAPEVMRPTALTLNIFVAVIATTKFYRAGAFSWRLFWPLAATSVPLALLGGMISLPSMLYNPVVGVALLCAAWMSLRRAPSRSRANPKAPPAVTAALAGSAIGFLAGLTGVGGGIFLAPVLLLSGWAEARVVAGISAAFILVNSAAGLAGVLSMSLRLPAELPFWTAAAVIGGFLGSELGSRHLGNTTLQRVLAVVLAIAGVKMVLAAW
jgi:uncharacterized membrane protein YfcA